MGVHRCLENSTMHDPNLFLLGQSAGTGESVGICLDGFPTPGQLPRGPAHQQITKVHRPYWMPGSRHPSQNSLPRDKVAEADGQATFGRAVQPKTGCGSNRRWIRFGDSRPTFASGPTSIQEDVAEASLPTDTAAPPTPVEQGSWRLAGAPPAEQNCFSPSGIV